jgi:excisionase family DNA binding protein
MTSGDGEHCGIPAKLKCVNDNNPQPRRPVRDWKTKREIAVHLKCSVRTISKFMRRRVLPFVKSGRFVRFDTDECDRAMEKVKSKSVLLG